MLAKNLPKGTIFPIIFTRLVLDGIAGIQFAFQLKFKHTFAILKAHFHFYTRVSKMLAKRGKTQQKLYFHHKSVIYSYFLKGKKKFSNL